MHQILQTYQQTQMYHTRPDRAPYHRIHIVGAAGSGKSSIQRITSVKNSPNRCMHAVVLNTTDPNAHPLLFSHKVQPTGIFKQRAQHYTNVTKLFQFTLAIKSRKVAQMDNTAKITKKD